MKQELIKIKDVWKKYDMGKAGALVVLREIDLEIYEGEFIAITGPSGSGKSTMMNIVGALDVPSWGRVDLKRKNISDMSESELAVLRGKTIGFIFQQFNLLPTLSALKNVMLPMEMIDVDSVAAEKRAIYLLSMLGLEDRIHHKPNELSGGQQQRVAIARSLSNDPPIILADEPTGNLDSKTGKFVMGFLDDLSVKEGKTIILITHDLNLVRYAQRIVYIKDGKVEKIIKNKGLKKMRVIPETSQSFSKSKMKGGGR
jgi:putative ABC transport system ATP-binding protein